jgi:outer membrane receptor protein involved in Fe transport
MYSASPGSLACRIAALPFLLACSTANAQSPSARQAFNIPQQPASAAVRRLVDQTHLQLLYSSSILAGVVASPVQGSMTPREALAVLLRGSHIEVIDTGPGAATLRLARPAPRAASVRARAKVDAHADEPVRTVFVTARKFSETLLEVPIAVSVFSERAIARRGATSLATMLQDAPGVSIYDAGSGFNKISIRGIATSLGGNENGFYLDDLPFSGVNVPLSPDVRTWDVDRIEVLRGPQGTLFGEGSMGGTVRTLTNNAKLNTFSFAGQTGMAQTQGAGASHAVKAMLNVPVIADMLALRIAATDEGAPGWIAKPGVGDGVNGDRVKTWRARMLFQPVDNLSINASYWRYDGRYEAGNNATDAGTAPQSGLFVVATPGYALKGVSATWELDDLTVYYGYFNNHYGRRSEGTFGAGPLSLNIDIDVSAQELRVSSTARKPWRWTGGVYRRNSVRRDSYVYALFGLDQRETTSSAAQSLFGEMTWTMPGFPLEASIGLRHFRDRLSGAAVNGGVADAADGATFSSNNPRVSLAYRPVADAEIYASASKGFRSGQRQATGFAQLAAANNVTLPAVINPDTIWTYELGTKINLVDRRLAMEYAVYHSNWRNVAVRIPLGTSGFNGLINSHGTTTNGVDATVSYALSSSLRTMLSGAFVDARYAGSVAGTSIRSGSPVDDVPRLTWSASAEADFALPRGWAGVARAGIQHAGAHRASTYPSDSTGDAIDNVHARVTASRGPWRVTLFGENLANDHGAVSYRTGSVVDAATMEAYSPRLRPRTIGLELGFAFE